MLASRLQPISTAELMIVNDLWRLAQTTNIDPEAVIKTTYEWRRDTLVSAARGCFAIAASLVLGVGVSLLKGEIPQSVWTVSGAVLGAAVLVGAGVNLGFFRVRRLIQEYRFAMQLLDTLRP